MVKITRNTNKYGRGKPYLSGAKSYTPSADLGDGFYLHGGKPRFHYNTRGPSKAERYNTEGRQLNNELVRHNQEVKKYNGYINTLPVVIKDLEKELADGVNFIRKKILNKKLAGYRSDLNNKNWKIKSLDSKSKSIMVNILKHNLGEVGLHNLLLGVKSSKKRTRPDNTCGNCHHKWGQRGVEKSKKCPKCKSVEVYSTKTSIDEIWDKQRVNL